MSLNWNFQIGGGGLNQKTLRGGSMDIFWSNTLQKETQLNVSANTNTKKLKITVCIIVLDDM